jgi:hypothetical protein
MIVEDGMKLVSGARIFIGLLTARGIGILTAVLVLASGCAATSSHAPVEAPVTDFKQVAGAWRTTGDSALQGSLIIQTNGRYWMRMGYIAALQGQFRLEGGVLLYELGPASPRRGRATLIDAQGIEVLRFIDDSGAIWMECVRSL